MEITDIDISLAEKVLLPEGLTFDDERRDFIKCLDSCDLLAVPGSGKTTALQAKLFCLSKHLPLEDNQGVLVLSHTNNAVDEIKKNLRMECYQLFATPHFIGTVQDFVDTFLAIPYYELFFKKKIHVIDDVAYGQEVDGYLQRHWESKGVNALKPLHYNFSAVRFHKDENNQLVFSFGIGTPIAFPKISKWERENTVEAKQNEIKEFIKKMKSSILQRGVLSYDDCYFLADSYIRKYPFVINTLRKRFKYIFIDETQDMKKYQLDLIDHIFDCDECCLQRIGDKNQTIYHKPDRTIPEQWKIRNPKTLLNSFRLTDTVAKIVNPFTVDKSLDENGNPRFVVTGKRQLDKGDIPPYLILFDKDSKEQLLTTFDNLINGYDLRNCEEGQKYSFHVIGWVLKPNDENELKNQKAKNKREKLHLKEIFPHSQEVSAIGHSAYSTLSEFLSLGCRKYSMEEAHAVICKVLIYVLRILGKKDTDKMYYSRTDMERLIRDHDEKMFLNYESFIYKASSCLYFKKYDECYKRVVEYIKTDFSYLFEISANNVCITNFCGNKFDASFLPTVADAPYPDIKIGSVHSVKGQTHCATMYVETFYKKYETEHVLKKRKPTKRNPNKYEPSPLFQEEADFSKEVTRMSAMRMMYVGFSRPTHLLCYAVMKENWDAEMIERMKKLGWEIIDFTVSTNN